MRRLRLALPMAVWAIACGSGSGSNTGATAPPATTSSPPGCAAAANVAWSSRGNQVLDSICVSDFDGDGALEIDDIQDAIALLAGAAQRTVTVLAGEYRSPANPTSRPGRKHGLIELGDDTALRCQPGAILRGPRAVDVNNDLSVVTNTDWFGGNRNIVITGCEIDGGAPDSFTGYPASSTRTGVSLRRTRNSLVEGNYVHHTYHTGLYTSNSIGDVFRGNRIEHAGGDGNRNPWRSRVRYPCIYAYSFGGEQVLDFVAESNQMRGCSASGLNTRAEHTDAPGDAIRNMRWIGNRIENTGFTADDGPFYRAEESTCMNIRGVDGALIADNECHSAGAVFLYHNATAFGSSGDENANTNVTIERLMVVDADAIAGIWIGPFVDGLVLRDIEVRGTRKDDGTPLDLSCLAFQPPFRRVLFERLELGGCGRIGIEEVVTPVATSADESLVIRDVTIDGVDEFAPLDVPANPGIVLRRPQDGLSIERVSVRETTGPAIQIEDYLDGAMLRDLRVDGVETGWIGLFSESGAPVCSASNERHWITTSDGSTQLDCDFTAGRGTAVARCGCLNGAWTPLPPRHHAGVLLEAGSQASRNVSIEDSFVANVRDDTGVRIQGDLVASSVARLVGADASAATDEDQNSAIEIPSASSDITLEDIRCEGTDPSVPCVEYASP